MKIFESKRKRASCPACKFFKANGFSKTLTESMAENKKEN
jgi:hypothetical protein